MRKLLFLVLAGASIVACKKDTAQDESIGFQDVSSFSDLKVSDDFDWEVAHQNTLDVTGLNSDVQSKHFLIVEDPNGMVVSKVWTAISENHQLSFELADQFDFVTVSYGSLKKQVSIKNRKGQFDYLPNDDRSDLDPTDR